VAAAEAAAPALEQHYLVEIAVVAGHRCGRTLEGRIPKLGDRACEDLALRGAARRRVWILARARAFVRISARLDFTVQIARLAAHAVDALELVVVGLDLVPRHAPVLGGAVLGKEALAVALGHPAADLEVVRQKAARVAAPVRGGPPHDLARLERSHLAHRQSGFAGVVAEGDRLAREILEDVAVAVVLELVVHVRHDEVRLRIGHAAALEAEHLEARIRKLHRHDRAYNAASHDDGVHGFHLRRRHLTSPLPASA
jgi:hypothetical protein